jgi:hypothetical protein
MYGSIVITSSGPRYISAYRSLNITDGISFILKAADLLLAHKISKIEGKLKIYQFHQIYQI